MLSVAGRPPRPSLQSQDGKHRKSNWLEQRSAGNPARDPTTGEGTADWAPLYLPRHPQIGQWWKQCPVGCTGHCPGIVGHATPATVHTAAVEVGASAGPKSGPGAGAWRSLDQVCSPVDTAPTSRPPLNGTLENRGDIIYQATLSR